jgi:hypothetical protein
VTAARGRPIERAVRHPRSRKYNLRPIRSAAKRADAYKWRIHMGCRISYRVSAGLSEILNIAVTKRATHMRMRARAHVRPRDRVRAYTRRQLASRSKCSDTRSASRLSKPISASSLVVSPRASERARIRYCGGYATVPARQAIRRLASPETPPHSRFLSPLRWLIGRLLPGNVEEIVWETFPEESPESRRDSIER